MFHNPPRYFSAADCRDVFGRVIRLTAGGGDTKCSILTSWSGNLRFALNRVISSGDVRDHTFGITRTVRGSSGGSTTNGFDDASLAQSIKFAEYLSRRNGTTGSLPIRDATLPRLKHLAVPLWHDATYLLDAPERSALAKSLVTPSIDKHLTAAGYIEVTAQGLGIETTDGISLYARGTDARYSVTVRTLDGTGSGWAGMSHPNWRTIDAQALSERALQKCIASMNPRAIEPGRWTAILEPQAVHDFIGLTLVDSLFRAIIERGGTPFSDRFRPSGTKLGLKVIDERLSLTTDLMDPSTTTWPFDVNSGEATLLSPASWITDGILTELAYDQRYASQFLMTAIPRNNPGTYRLAGSGALQSLEEMIANTKRGLVVTRFWGVQVVDRESGSYGGFTRDGLWLVENGKITMPVKNLRFTESPFFALNNVEAIGAPQQVYADKFTPCLAPALKIRDFNFTSLSDAI